MLANDVAVADTQIAALAGEVLVERIGAEYSSGRDLVAVAERGPALYIDVRFQAALCADDDIFFDDRILADQHLWTDPRARVHARRGRYYGGRINGHKFV